jgi:hypothetical protein
MRKSATRREFIKTAATTAAAVATATTATSAAATSPETSAQTADSRKASTKSDGVSQVAQTEEQWRRRAPKKETIVLDKPHVVSLNSPFLNSSGEIANKRFVLDPRRLGEMGFPTGTLGRPFGVPNPLSAFGLLTLPPGAKNIRIVDCDFEGPWRSIGEIPFSPPGHPKYLRGIDMHYATGIRIEGCSFDFLPAAAICFYGSIGIEIEDVWSTNCPYLVRADWMGVNRNRYIRLNRLHHADGWNGADLGQFPSYASAYQPGRAVGVNAVNGYFADSEISNLTTSGEVKSAIKLVNPVRVALDRIYSSTFMIQGTTYWNSTSDPSEGNGKIGGYNPLLFDQKLGDHAVDVEITRSRFRPKQNAWLFGDRGNTVQLSFHQENIKFHNCVFYKPDQSTAPHQAIQAWDGVDVDVRDSLFVGWESPADPLRPFPKQSIIRVGDYGNPGSLPASINADFSRVNKFRPT